MDTEYFHYIIKVPRLPHIKVQESQTMTESNYSHQKNDYDRIDKQNVTSLETLCYLTNQSVGKNKIFQLVVEECSPIT